MRRNPAELSKDERDIDCSRPEAAPALSLVVCTIGRVHELQRLLSSLEEQSFQSFEVVLVDQNPDDYLANIIAAYSSKLSLKQLRSQPGLSKARNVGLRSAKGAVVGFPDDDCWYGATTAAHVMRFFAKEPHFDVLLGRTVDEDGVETVSPFRRSSGPGTRSNVWRSGNSNTLFARSETARQLGFDEALGVGAATPFKSGEESDFLLRALAAGKRIYFDHDLLIHHAAVHAESEAAHLERARSYSTGFGYVLRKHDYGAGYLFYRAARSLGSSMVSAAMLDLAAARYKSAWTMGTLRGYFGSNWPGAS
jgi:glycosyltransferase involved in cell wall biosynthesis